MNLELFLAFFVAAEIVVIIPGPTVTLVVSQAMVHGRSSVIPLVMGVAIGDVTAMSLSLLGLGAVLAVSSTLFTVLKWIGALYLIFLGLRLWRSSPIRFEETGTENKPSPRSLRNSAFVVTALNPKGIAFFVSFLPQFVDYRQPVLPQFLVLGTTFLILATLNASLYAFFSGRLREAVHNTKVLRWFSRLGGTALIGAGIFMAAVKHNH
ncbi:MAG: LysE family translocator [Desulfohalobiaceae bacterium]|nr:LysE family translocator [Desulfohalobiaceae bacterium]